MSARRIAGWAAFALVLALSPASAGDGLMLVGATNGGRNAFASACAGAGGILASSNLCIFDSATTASTATFNPSAIPGTITIAMYGQAGNGQPAASTTLGGQAGAAGSYGAVTGLTHSGAYTITRTAGASIAVTGTYLTSCTVSDSSGVTPGTPSCTVTSGHGTATHASTGSARATSYAGGAGGGAMANSLGASSLGGFPDAAADGGGGAGGASSGTTHNGSSSFSATGGGGGAGSTGAGGGAGGTSTADAGSGTATGAGGGGGWTGSTTTTALHNGGNGAGGCLTVGGAGGGGGGGGADTGANPGGNGGAGGLGGGGGGGGGASATGTLGSGGLGGGWCIAISSP